MKKSAGFTLIELLVVIGIISALAVAILPNILGGQQAANEETCRRNQSWIYGALITYKGKFKKSAPKGDGSEVLRNLWHSGVFAKTEQNLQRCWCPAKELSEEKEDLLKKEMTDIFKGEHDTTLFDYAFLGKRYKADMRKEGAVILADDNEDGWNHANRSITATFASGAQVTWPVMVFTDNEDVGKWDLFSQEEVEADDFEFSVGKNSPFEKLRRLRY